MDKSSKKLAKYHSFVVVVSTLSRLKTNTNADDGLNKIDDIAGKRFCCFKTIHILDSHSIVRFCCEKVQKSKKCRSVIWHTTNA